MGNGKHVYKDYTNPDTDGDGLLDGEEVTMHYVPHSGGYFISHSDPTLIDSDKDGIPDAQEPKHRRMIYDVSDRTMLHISNLAYVNLESEVNKRIANASNIGNEKRLDELKDEMGDWTIVKANDGGFFSAGFGGVAVKKGHDIVIGYRGTETDNIFEGTYDVIADLGILFSNNNLHMPLASNFAADIVLSYEHAKSYVTGHSLGGFLAQVVSYRMLNQKLQKVYFPFTSNRTILKEILARESHFKKGVTFNAAPFLHHSYTVGIAPVARPAIPLTQLKSNKYDDKVFNYSIVGDFLQAAEIIKIGDKFGKIVPSFSKNLDENAHALIQFYEHFPKYDK